MPSSLRFTSFTFLTCLSAVACGPSKAAQISTVDPVVYGPELDVTVKVDVEARGVTLPETAIGMHASVYDNALHRPEDPDLLRAAGVRLLRWPGGGYSDNYHWSTHKMTPWPPKMAGERPSTGYLARGSDFGGFTRLLKSFDGLAMITVNYGSNLQGTGPGEPKEAAAWVAYANGAADDATVIGVDSVGNDWQTVGYWASLREAAPLAENDGQNFLRIASGPLAIRHWEVGNELFGNGYYQSDNGFELDLHLPYDGTVRRGHPALSPTTYGKGVREFISAMKAVDPSILIAAVLNTPPMDYSWGPDWNERVLAECGMDIDFAVVHWYPSGPVNGLPDVPRQNVARIRNELDRSFAACCSARTSPIEVAVTELGPNSGNVPTHSRFQSVGLFAANAHAEFLSRGFFNIDWLELHNGTFLSESSSSARGPAYHGIQMVHHLLKPGDTFVEASVPPRTPLGTFAADRADGSVGLMLVNTLPKTTVTAQVEISGATLSTSAERYDYLPEGVDLNGTVSGPVAESGGNALQLVLPAYSVTTVIIPRL